MPKINSRNTLEHLKIIRLTKNAKNKFSRHVRNNNVRRVRNIQYEGSWCAAGGAGGGAAQVQKLKSVQQLNDMVSSPAEAAETEVAALANPAAVPQDPWKPGKLMTLSDLSPPDNIKFRSMSVEASDVAEMLGVQAKIKPGAKVLKIDALNYVDEGRTETVQFWDLGSLAFALAGDRWADQKKANQVVKNDDDLKKYENRRYIQVTHPEVTYFLFCTVVLICTGYRVGTLYKLKTTILVVLMLVPLN